MPKDLRHHVETCDKCQRLKRHTEKYGELQAKLAQFKPWRKLCVDLIGPYSVQTLDFKIYHLHALTMIDPATSWFEIIKIPDKTSETTVLQADSTFTVPSVGNSIEPTQRYMAV